jgi:hypothetical protein
LHLNEFVGAGAIFVSGVAEIFQSKGGAHRATLKSKISDTLVAELCSAQDQARASKPGESAKD